MAQFLFFSLLTITLLAGFFAYFSQSPKPIHPLKFAMDSSGYSAEMTTNHNKSQQLNITATNGLIQVRQQIDDLAQAQNKLFNSIQDQEHVLKDTSRNISNILLEAQQSGGKDTFDVLQLKALTSQMQNQQLFLVAHGNDLVSLNDQLTENRQLIAGQLDAVNVNTQASLDMLQQRYASLKDQASGFFNKGIQYNQELNDQMDKIQGQLRDLVDKNAIQEQDIKDRIMRMLDKEHEDMERLADSEQRSRDLARKAQEKLADSEELTNDSLQRTQDLIDDERQKEEDQKQRVADQMQRLQDQQGQ